MAELTPSSKSYQDLLARLKNQIRTAQLRAAVAVNQELVLLYWRIGTEILTRQRTDGWGDTGDRTAGEGSAFRIPGDAGALAAQPGLYEGVRGSLARRSNFASAACKIDLVPQYNADSEG